MRVVLMFLFVLANGACAGQSISGKGWLQSESENFKILSDAPAAKTKFVADELERFRVLALSLAGLPQSTVGEPVKIFVMEEATFNEFQPAEHYAGFYIPSRRTIVMSIYSHHRAQELVYHEYVHELQALSGIQYPAWYREGLAEFLSTARFADNSVEIGRPPTDAGLKRVRDAAMGTKIKATGSNLARKESEAGEINTFYVRSWGMVHLMLLGHLNEQVGVDRREQLNTFLQLWANDVPHDEAFVKAFGMSFDAFQGEVDQYFRLASFAYATLPMAPAEGEGATTQAAKEGHVRCELSELAGHFEKAELRQRIESHGTSCPKGDEARSQALGSKETSATAPDKSKAESKAPAAKQEEGEAPPKQKEDGADVAPAP